MRRAISMVIDRDYLAEKVWQNAMLPAYSLVPPGVAGYTASMVDFAAKAPWTGKMPPRPSSPNWGSALRSR